MITVIQPGTERFEIPGRGREETSSSRDEKESWVTAIFRTQF